MTSPVPFILRKDAESRATVMMSLVSTVNDLPLDDEWQITLQKYSEKRRSVQNRLHRRWCRDIELFKGQVPGYGHAWTKYEVLLPMKLACEDERIYKRALYEQAYLKMIERMPVDAVPDEWGHLSPYERVLRSAYDVIRSKTITVDIFAEWMNEYKRFWAGEGLVLIAQTPKEQQALMRAA